MNHLRIYFRIVRNALKENRIKGVTYYESHHIRPRSMNGSNRKNNLVLLTAREHFLCHALLACNFNKNRKYSLAAKRAFHMMACHNPLQRRHSNARFFEYNRIKLYGPNGCSVGKNATRFGVSTSDKTKKKQSQSRKNYIRNNPEEINRLKSMALTRTTEHQQKISNSLSGRKVSDSAKQKLSDIGKTKIGFLNNNSNPCSINGTIYGSVQLAMSNHPEIKNLRNKLKDDRFPDLYLIKKDKRHDQCSNNLTSRFI